MRFMIIDVILLTVLAYFAFNGTRRGFINEISTVVALIAGFTLANLFHQSTGDFIAKWIREDSFRFVISYLLIFVVIVSAVKIIAALLQKFLEIVLLGWLNHILGLLLGILKGLLLISLLIFMLQSFPRAAKLSEQMDSDSYLYHVCRTLKDWAITAIANNPHYEDYRDSLKEKTSENNIQKIIGNIQ